MAKDQLSPALPQGRRWRTAWTSGSWMAASPFPPSRNFNSPPAWQLPQKRGAGSTPQVGRWRVAPPPWGHMGLPRQGFVSLRVAIPSAPAQIWGAVHHFFPSQALNVAHLPHRLPAIKNFILKTERFNLKIQNGKGRVFK